MDFKGKRMLERAASIGVEWAYKEPKGEVAPDAAILFDNVQFIYELALAQLELRSFGFDFEVTNGLREFKIKDGVDWEVAARRCAYFKQLGRFVADYFYIVQRNRTRSVNQYLTHWIYPYKGKFHPQMIRALINIIGLQQGETVLDPFIGSGTTALEAQLLGVNCIGFDASPLCVLQSKVKTRSLDAVETILEAKDEYLSTYPQDLFAKGRFGGPVAFTTGNEAADDFFRMAELVAISDHARRKRDFQKALVKNLDLMIHSVLDYRDVVRKLNLRLGHVDIRVGDARRLPLPDASVDGIVTSPPYSIALDYIANDAHALQNLGYDLKSLREKFIGVRGRGKERVELYNEDMRHAFAEMARVLKPGRYAVLVLGNATYQGKEVPTVEFTVSECEGVGLRLVHNILKIIFGLYNVMRSDNILVFRRV